MRALQPYAVQNIGLVDFYGKFLAGTNAPVVMAPATRHYSWPKAMTLLGLGQNNLLTIGVDLQARMAVDELEHRLDQCLASKTPVIAVIAVIGSTEESAVDPLRDIVALRETFRNRGLDFAIHCDAAWGGYFNTIRTPSTTKHASPTAATALPDGATRAAPAFPRALRTSVGGHTSSAHEPVRQRPIRRDGRTRLDHGRSAQSGIRALSLRFDLLPQLGYARPHLAEGSRSVSLFRTRTDRWHLWNRGSKPVLLRPESRLAHQVIPLSQSGYGKILGQCMWTSNACTADW